MEDEAEEKSKEPQLELKSKKKGSKKEAGKDAKKGSEKEVAKGKKSLKKQKVDSPEKGETGTANKKKKNATIKIISTNCGLPFTLRFLWSWIA